jgi:hypothetical protein
VTPEVKQALDEHDEQLALEFEAMAEKLRQREADVRSRGGHELATIYAAQARENIIAAGHCRSHIEERAFQFRIYQGRARIERLEMIIAQARGGR